MALSLPVGLAAFLVVTARAVVAFVDGPHETLYGFPLFWIKAGPTSLSVVVDVPAAAVDLALYVLATSAATAAALRVWPRVARSRATRLAAWLVAAVAIGACAIVLSPDAYAGGVTFDPAFRWANVERYTLYLGVPT